MDTPDVIRAYLSKIGSKRTPRKTAASSINIRKAQQAHASSLASREAAYRVVNAKTPENRISMTRAAVEVAKCSYYTLKTYCARRDAGETVEQIAANHKKIRR